jgi:hypothetical protein
LLSTSIDGGPVRAALLGALLALCALAVDAPPASALQWNLTQLPEESTALYGASCPSPALCVVVGSNGTLATSGNPTGGAGTWSVTHFDGAEEVHLGDPNSYYAGGQVRGVSCPTTEFCAAMSRQGYIYASTNPAGGAPAWSAIALQPEKKSRGSTPTASPAPRSRSASGSRPAARSSPRPTPPGRPSGASPSSAYRSN